MMTLFIICSVAVLIVSIYEVVCIIKREIGKKKN